MRPVDLIYGDDLKQPEVRKELYDRVEREKPKLVWFASPFTDWCGFSRLNFSKQELRRRRKRQKVFLEMMNEVMLTQIQGGRRDHREPIDK